MFEERRVASDSVGLATESNMFEERRVASDSVEYSSGE
jgi:hypothetical protein